MYVFMHVYLSTSPAGFVLTSKLTLAVEPRTHVRTCMYVRLNPHAPIPQLLGKGRGGAMQPYAVGWRNAHRPCNGPNVAA